MQARNRHVLQAAGGRNRRHQKRNRGRTLSWGWGRIPKTEGSRLDNREHLEASTCTHCFFAPLNPGAGRFQARSPRGWETGCCSGVATEEQGAGKKGVSAPRTTSLPGDAPRAFKRQEQKRQGRGNAPSLGFAVVPSHSAPAHGIEPRRGELAPARPRRSPARTQPRALGSPGRAARAWRVGRGAEAASTSARVSKLNR